MAKYKVGIKVVEYYRDIVIVDADSPEVAKERVNQTWLEDSWLYEKVTDFLADQEVEFTTEGIATDLECEYLTNIDGDEKD